MTDRSCSRVALALFKAARTELACPVCFECLTDPVGLACTHIFCRVCLTRALERLPLCPLCKAPVTSARCTIPLLLVAQLLSLARNIAERAGVDDITESQIAFPSLPPSPKKYADNGMQHVSPNKSMVSLEMLPLATLTCADADGDDIGSSRLSSWRMSPAEHQGKNVASFAVSTPPQRQLSEASEEATVAECASTEHTKRPRSPALESSSSISIDPSFLPTKKVVPPPPQSSHPVMCALCRLDVTSRPSMRSFLRYITSNRQSDVGVRLFLVKGK